MFLFNELVLGLMLGFGRNSFQLHKKVALFISLRFFNILQFCWKNRMLNKFTDVYIVYLCVAT